MPGTLKSNPRPVKQRFNPLHFRTRGYYNHAPMNDVKEWSPLEQMIQQQIVDRGITDERVVDAIRSVPRERFFSREGQRLAFRDQASPIGHGQTISQPYIVALMTQRLDVRPDGRVLEVGTGSGYQTAILCKLAGEVFSVERVKPLLDE